MQHICDDDLGVNHKLHMIRKTDSSGLAHSDLQNTLKQIGPDFVYLHLGINDIFKGKDISDIATEYGNFIMFRDKYIPNAKIIFSFPLLTGDNRFNIKASHLCNWINDLVWKLEDPKLSLKDSQQLTNTNSNFEEREGLFKSDEVHLTTRGEQLIRANLRFCIHTLTRVILGKPKRLASRK